MDTTIAGIGAVVVAQLRAADYMESTVGQYQKTIKALTEFASGREYSVELGAQFASMTISARTGRFSAARRFDYRRLIALFDSYVQTGRVDLSVRGRGGGGPGPRSSEFVALNADWEAEMAGRGLAPATREAYGRMSRGYLVFLEARGITMFDDADGSSVLAFLQSLLNRWAASSLFWVVSNLRPFLKFTGRTDLVYALNLAGIKRFHSIVPALDDAVAERVVRACVSGIVSARDAAITLLALSTGLRACDIVALRLGDVDWRGATIGIVQQKTGNPLTLPLPALLLNKLAAYVLDERPRGGSDDHLFLRVKAPHLKLGDHAAVHRVTTETFRKAGVTGVQAGTRRLRHSAASRLLASAVPLPTIAAVLGHASEESTNVYMSVDRTRLLGCVLPVPGAVRS